MVPAATPNVNGYSGRYWPVAPPSVTCKREAPRNDGDTGAVSAVGTSMLKRSSRAQVLGETRSGQLPRAPDGRLEPRPIGAIGPIDWRHVGPDLTRGTEGWLSLAPAWADPARTADGYRDKAGVSCDKKWRVGSEDLCRYGIYCSDPSARSTASSERMACSGENGERGRPMIMCNDPTFRTVN
ncbi:hypothetical protein TIFTF001_022914 [Ficus carica]|uniref:Uncharacterized protein n=1 Tax=Ficus carica TaxID=3494 RepID=A0AA88AK01_FICCA|nr:hypothetical protein TIFTF001_022914 [Ficus carica]